MRRPELRLPISHRETEPGCKDWSKSGTRILDTYYNTMGLFDGVGLEDDAGRFWQHEHWSPSAIHGEKPQARGCLSVSEDVDLGR